MKSGKAPKILMFGWEFPPFNSGGLGVACEGLVGGLASFGARITFVLPKKIDCKCKNCNFVFGNELKRKENYLGIKTVEVDSPLSPYLKETDYQDVKNSLSREIIERNIYRGNLVEEVLRYASLTKKIIGKRKFDVIHSHDWLSLPAGLEAKRLTGKPLVFQIHATEFDRVGQQCLNPDIYAIEKEGLERADAVVAVSNYTKRRIVDCYHIDPNKVRVVPNAINHNYPARLDDKLCDLKKDGKKVVLFVGRLTFQKGPDYFLRAAKKVLEINPNVMFVFSGSGDMERWLVEEAARLGLADKVVFAGFMRGNDLTRLYQMADLYVMSSVSEPFGLTGLEALANGTPVLVSRQSGVGEMINHCLKVDFWDINQMANKILAVVNYPELQEVLQCNGSREVRKFSWVESARKCLSVYGEVLNA